ncbi:MAG: hypothetical protein V3T14_07600, partial [Myxococcota bacterium]
MNDWLTPEIERGFTREQRELAVLLGREIGRSLDPRELRRRGPGGIAEITVQGMSLLSTLRDHEVRVRVENPQGHRSKRTVVEVATRDCPFLLDTLRMNLRRMEFREITLLHPLLPIVRGSEGQL